MDKVFTTKKECYQKLGIAPRTFDALIYKNKNILPSLTFEPFSLSESDLEKLASILEKERAEKLELEELKASELSVDAIRKLSAVEKERMQIEKAEVELELMAGKLIDRDQLQTFLTHKFSLMVHTLSSIPYQLSEELASTTDQKEIEKILKQALKALLEELSKPVE